MLQANAPAYGLINREHSCSMKNHMVGLFEMESNIDALIGILGETVITDIRKRKPKIGLAPATLMSLDQVNVIVGKPVCEMPFCTRTKNDGVDLIFDGQWYVTL